MVTLHTIIEKDIGGMDFGVEVLAQGKKDKSQVIFHVIRTIGPENEPDWYLNKRVSPRDQHHDATGLQSSEHTHIGNFPEQKENPMKVFELFPEYFL